MAITDIFLAASGGLITASWGAFKDAPYEGFSGLSFVRSLISTVIYYLLLAWLLGTVGGEASKLTIMFAAVAFERITQEFWKGFFRRRQREGIYKIPQDFHIFGKVADSNKRLVVGISMSVALIIATYLMAITKIVGDSWIIIGIIAAIIPSIGGAWKDAPIEGFDIKKFPRSFIVMFVAVSILHYYTNNLLLLVMGAAGLERILVEFYKTFVVLSTPGKFFEKVHHPEWKTKRSVFVYSYILALVSIVFFA